ncbi:30S ribosomal protein S4 [Candidatus Beckwithbacteria bacterium CG10_big_fil_rev_8_21_14_0_10_34_10]|uniref:Small ribosomal subunit protein uS4 n=1 Tax=Candidatus Beckwithbacteria bacterium CG10_big_fil_rev_8_21_14_0_10_34_10 TaxID=1974495 RepID=A0A2H0W7U8_9BACT|nr:MAG: 30S ribosomal protein S4 [Candidatus Beckwithbacteria bacterium CG10_big_fil_rev_8_21_14_0_10_34_10]
MARYVGPKCRLCRREGVKLFLKGDRCLSPKCPLDRKGAVPPGVHGAKRSRRLSDYGIQLREKQKAKRTYGVLERQFKKYYKNSASHKMGAGLRLLQTLERRLDNVLFRSGLVSARSFGRQLITHGKVVVDGKKVSIPSYQLKIGQVITLSSKALELGEIKKAVGVKRTLPKWLNRKAVVVKIERLPLREEIEADINERLIIEFYSR